jgi:hypothetical protein
VRDYYCGYNLRRVTKAQQYFQELRIYQEYDEVDGAAVGEAFMIKTKAENKSSRKDRYRVRVTSIVNKHVGMKDFSNRHPWFRFLIQGMLSRRLRDPAHSTSKFENLSNREALAIGRSFSLALFDRLTANAAVEMFVNEHSSLIELKKRERFFVPMALTIGQRQLERAPWGLLFTVGTGAMLGMLDVATDVYAIANFTFQRKTGYAIAVAAAVSVSMAIQLITVCANGRKRGTMHVMKEAMIVLSGFKPAVDAFRVIGGAKIHEDDVIDPRFELILAKVVEL